MIPAKKKLRSALKRRLLQFEKHDTETKSLITKFTSSEWYKRSEIICGYVPLGKLEPKIEPLLRIILKEKQLFLPRVVNQDELHFYRIQGLDDFEGNVLKNASESKYKIPEPTVDFPRGSAIKRIDLLDEIKMKKSEVRVTVIVPGLGFDEKGARIGKGMGYYDRYLTKLSEIQDENVSVDTVALALSCQKCEIGEIPMNEYDKAIQCVIFP